MIKLPEIKKWSGDGFGQNPRILTLIKRNEWVALYSRKVEESGVEEGYEVFIVKMRHKGDKLPGGLEEQEDREVYPSVNSFGKTAWSVTDLVRAEKMFLDLTKEQDPDAVSVKEIPLTLPTGEFTVGEMATLNKVEYPKAFLFIKAAVESGSVKFLREERRNAKGKPSKIYIGA